ncbi:oligopeptide/dipeptide ABC transporter ATP-binding protein [Azospirillum halopraeferens]|uniref:oligopeptide/dipeptide ABC transporter ATP-binding protein n=1 Tax=Azospirillum halopraeferens TaxID=34010 RepID=UPI00041D2547|nr:oligopeptide/dipeptide ABC transporter ATP-binding protein [Azospirillum halopraeferens]
MSHAAPLRAEGLTVRAGSVLLLDRIALTVAPGEVVAIRSHGDPGAGLLLRVLAGLPPPGVAVEGTAAAPARAVLLPRGGPLTPHRTLGAHFTEVLATRGLDRRAAERRAVELLEEQEVPAAARRLVLRPHELTPGLRWRAVLALALAAAPAAILADAPAAELDATVRAHLLHRLAARARADGIALLLAGRDGDGTSAPADRVLDLDGGRLGPAPAAVPLPALGDAAPAGPPALSVRDLRVVFPLGGGRDLAAVDGVGFDAADGDAIALLGESGSGKAILARALVRLVPVAGGRITWLGQDLTARDPATLRLARHVAQPVFPDARAALTPGLTVGEQIVEAVAALVPRADPAARLDLALREAGLPAAAARRYPADLTPGEAALAGLARALAPGPALLVADEPLAMLDAGERAAVLDRLLHARSAHGLTLVLATADAGLALRAAHRILVMMGGRVVESADADTLRRGALHPLTRALLAVADGRPPDLTGDPPSPLMPPSGCALRLRCPHARDHCAGTVPDLETVGPGHRVACHFPADAGVPRPLPPA